MPARLHLTHINDREDILILKGMRGADTTFRPGLKEVGRIFGVTISEISDAGFNLEYSVQPPISPDRVKAFAELVTEVAVNALPGSGPDYPIVDFSYQEDPDHRGEFITSSYSLLRS